MTFILVMTSVSIPQRFS